MCTPIFIATLCTLVKTWKQPKCPLTDEWIKMWYIPYNRILAIGSLVTKSCPTLVIPQTVAMPGSSVYRIFQARLLDWVSISFSTGSSWPRDWNLVFCTAGSFFTDWATTEARINHQKGWNNAIWRNMDETGDYDTKWSKSDREM